MKKSYIDHDQPLTIPQFTKLGAANKAIQQLYCALMNADSTFKSMQEEKGLFKEKPYYGGLVSTTRVTLASTVRWLDFVSPKKM